MLLFFRVIFRNDYGVRSLQSILDMVKVFDFALSNGKVVIFYSCSNLFMNECNYIVTILTDLTIIFNYSTIFTN